MVTFVPGGVVSFTISPSTVNCWIKPDVPPQSPMSPWTRVPGVEKSTLEGQAALLSTRTANLPKEPRLQIADEYAFGQSKGGVVAVGVGVGVAVGTSQSTKEAPSFTPGIRGPKELLK